MEKEPQPESMATVAIKPEYAPSEYSSEPPPAYQKPKSSSVQIAKIVAVTVVVTAVVLGSFMLASAYVSATASCRQLEQELEFLSEAADRLQPAPQAEALVQDDPILAKRHSDPLTAEEPKHETKEIENNNIDNEQDSSSENSESDSNSDSSSSSSSSSDSDEEIPIHLPLPLQLDLEQLAQALIEKNQKTKMNCVVEKKKAEEIVDHKPKTIRLPFGVNLTTDPRYEKISGERMVIVCESGTLQRTQPPPPPPQPQHDDEDDQEEDTIMIQPVMIPIPQTPFHTHMPQQMAPPMMQNPQAMRQPMQFPMRPPMRPPVDGMRPPMPIMQIQIQQQQQPPQPPQAQDNEMPPSAIVHHIVQEIITRKIMEAQRAREEQLKQQQQQEVEEQRVPQRFQMPPGMMPNRFPVPEEIISQLNRLPNRDVIVAVSAESDDSDEDSQESRNSEENQITREIRPFPQHMRPVPPQIRPMPQEMRPMPQEIRPMPNDIRQMPQQIRPFSQEIRPIPQEIRPAPQEVPQQIRLIPHEIRVIPHEVQSPQEMSDHQEVHSQVQMRVVPQPHQEVNEQQEVHPRVEMHVVPQEMRFIQEQRTSANEMNGRQAFARALPVNIPVSMMPQEHEQQEVEPQGAASEESRPHYVQPRSVRVEA